MIFNSLEFMFFFPIVVIIYYLFPKKIRYIWLLIASYYFYMCWNAKYALLLLFSTSVTYSCGLALEYIKKKDKETFQIIRHKKICVSVGVVLNLILLIFFKYFDFFTVNIERILRIVKLDINFPELDIILPVGISFYIFQALGYMIDVYRDDIYAEKNFFRYALFVSFFPQLVAGPIERSKNLLVQLQKEHKLTWDNFREGVLLILWGLFLKIAIADRAAIVVNTVYENLESYFGTYIIIATIAFAFQIYCDFYGYSIIAKGTALILGIRLMNNFNAPYLSRSIKEFWQRWHISLSSWFRDYLYIPLGGNRKGIIRKESNLLIVFLLSGLWHGASFAFITWGLLNGIFQMLGDFVAFIKRKIGLVKEVYEETWSRGLLQRIITFFMICFTWIFFRAGDMSNALIAIKNMLNFEGQLWIDSSMYQMGLTTDKWIVLIIFVLILIAIDNMKYRGVDPLKSILRQEWWFQAAVYIVLFWIIVLFGCYGGEYEASQFIYFQF